MQWGHSLICRCAVCHSIPRIQLLVAKGSQLSGFAQFAGERLRATEQELSEALSRKGFPEETLPAPPKFFEKFPHLIAFDSRVPPPPALPNPDVPQVVEKDRPAQAESAKSKSDPKPRETVPEVSQSPVKQAAEEVTPKTLLSSKAKAKPPGEASSSSKVKRESEAKEEEKKSPIAEVDLLEEQAEILTESPRKEKKYRSEASRERRRSRSQGRKASPRRRKRSKSKKSKRGERDSPRRGGGDRVRKARAEEPREPDHPPPGLRGELPRRPRSPPYPPAHHHSRGSRQAGPGWVGERPTSYKHWGKNKGVVKRAKQARRRERLGRDGA